MTNGNHVTHNNKHTILINKTKFTQYCVPPAHAPASVLVMYFFLFVEYTKVVITLNKSPTNGETLDGDSLIFLRTPSKVYLSL